MHRLSLSTCRRNDTAIGRSLCLIPSQEGTRPVGVPPHRGTGARRGPAGIVAYLQSEKMARSGELAELPECSARPEPAGNADARSFPRALAEVSWRTARTTSAICTTSHSTGRRWTFSVGATAAGGEQSASTSLSATSTTPRRTWHGATAEAVPATSRSTSSPSSCRRPRACPRRSASDWTTARRSARPCGSTTRRSSGRWSPGCPKRAALSPGAVICTWLPARGIEPVSEIPADLLLAA